MKSAILSIAGTILAASVMAADTTVVVIPAFQDFFAGPNQPVVVVSGSRNALGTPSGLIPSQRGVAAVNTTGNRVVRTLDPTVVNVPVFPGTVATAQDETTVSVFPQGIGFAPITNIFGQVIGAGQSTTALPPRTTGAGAATNAVPLPAAPRPTSPEFNDNGLGQPTTIQGATPTQPAGTTPVQPGSTPGIPASRSPLSTGTPTDVAPAPASPRPSR